jgi:hypothetical protein
MAEFRRLPRGTPVRELTLHRGNAEVYVYFVEKDQGKKSLTFVSTGAFVAEVTSTKMNNAPEGIRQVRLAARKTGQAEIRAMLGQQVLDTLRVRVVEPISLPPQGSESGALARLLLAEAASPLEGSFVEVDVLKSMKWMHLVIYNRLKNDPGQFYADGAKNTLDIIRARGQFKGFEQYPTLSAPVQARIDDILRAANDDNHSKQDVLTRFARSAIEISSSASTIPDPSAPRVLTHWRKAGHGEPRGRARLFMTLAGNTFFSIPKGPQP